LPRYSTTPALWEFEHRVLRQLSALPAVDTVASAICLPLQIGPNMPAAVLGQRQPSALGPVYRTVSPDYFRALKIPLIGGRSFADTDTADATPVIIINNSFAQQMFTGRDPLGEHIQLGIGLGAEYADPPRVIVGIAGDVRETSLDQPAQITVFIPRAQVPSSLTAPINRLVGTSWVVRTKISPAQLVGAVRRTILTIDPQQPISNVSTMEQMLSTGVEHQRFTLLLMTIFAALGILIAAVGIYGVISYGVTQRTHEIGIRMALGERKGNVLRTVIENAMKIALIGIGIGTVASLMMVRLLSGLLFGVRPTDPVTFVAVAFLLLVVALLACYFPARRATKVDPVVALRHE
jgi:putative ABC transport system permease protein